MNNSPTIIFSSTYFVWCMSEIILNRLLRTKTTDRQNTDKGTLSMIWITILSSITLSIYISAAYEFRISENLLIRYLGLIIIYLGVILRFLVVRSLGKYFTVSVTIRQDHQLKKDGFYKYLRHPSYFASLLSFFGFGFTLNNWFSVTLLTTAIFLVFTIRIRVEEQVLIGQFGEEYKEYQRSTWRIIPFLY